MIKLGNWVGERTTTVGAGAIVMVGRLDGFASFSILGDGEVYYTIQDGIAKETGIGTLTGNVMERNKVSATIDSVGNYSTENTPIYLSGNAHVFCTANADFMAHLHNGIDTIDANILKALQSAEAAELSKQQAELAAKAADSSKVAAAGSESKVAQSVADAAASATYALASKNSAATSESNAASSSAKSANSAAASEASAVNSKRSETNAQSAATAAAVSASSAKSSETSSAGSATAAKQSKDEAEEIVNTIGTSVADAAASAEAAQRHEVAAQSAAGSAQDSATVAQLSEAGAVAAKDKAQEKADEFKSYIIFLNDIAEWMTATGQVEIELPNGQKVTLEDVKGLASREWVGEMLYKPNSAVTRVQSPNKRNVVQLEDRGTVGFKDTVTDRYRFALISDGSTRCFSDGEYTGLDLVKNDGRYVRFETNPHAGSTSMLSIAYRQANGENQHVVTIPYDNGVVATRSWIQRTTGWGTVYADYPPYMTNFTNTNLPNGMYRFDKNSENPPSVIEDRFGSVITTRYSGDIGQRIVLPNYGATHMAIHRYTGSSWESVSVMTSNMYIVDGSGYYKKSSPIVQIYPDGHYKTNDESEGAEVSCTGTGQYHITGILGYNSDGAWGVNGGVSVPKDNNGLELVYVDDRVQKDGSIIIETCHRQHAHLPERFQNWRLKDITLEGERVFYQDGEPCDLPESTRLDVRVEMPQGSVWNVKQRELAEQMEREYSECEAHKEIEKANNKEE